MTMIYDAAAGITLQNGGTARGTFTAVPVTDKGPIYVVGIGDMEWSGAAYVSLGKFNSSGTIAVSGNDTFVTGIPAKVQRVRFILSGVINSGTTELYVQLGTSAGQKATGYLSFSVAISSSNVPTAAGGTVGFLINGGNAANDYTGEIIFERISVNTWVASGMVCTYATGALFTVTGRVTLADELTLVRLATGAGTTPFTSGSIKAIWEF